MPYAIDLVELVPQPTLSITVETTQAGLAGVFDRCFPALFGELQRQGRSPAAPPYARYHRFDDAAVTVEVGVPVDAAGESGNTAAGPVEPGTLPGGEAAGLYHVGPYDGLKAAYDALEAWLKEAGRERASGPWENYVVDPSRQPDPQRWKTRILQPLAPKQPQGTP